MHKIRIILKSGEDFSFVCKDFSFTSDSKVRSLDIIGAKKGKPMWIDFGEIAAVIHEKNNMHSEWCKECRPGCLCLTCKKDNGEEDGEERCCTSHKFSCHVSSCPDYERED